MKIKYSFILHFYWLIQRHQAIQKHYLDEIPVQLIFARMCCRLSPTMTDFNVAIRRVKFHTILKVNNCALGCNDISTRLVTYWLRFYAPLDTK